MLDPITTIGLAGNIVQFVDFSWKLLSETKGMYDSTTGTLAEYDIVEAISDDIIRLDDALMAPSAAGAIPEQIRNLASQCREIAQELLSALAKVKAQEPHKKWKSFVAALRNVWRKGEIENLVRRLDRLRDQMQLRLQWLLW